MKFSIKFCLLILPLLILAVSQTVPPPVPQPVNASCVISALPDDCGYGGMMQYSDTATPAFMWKLQPCHDTFLNDTQFQHFLHPDISTQSLTIDLSVSNLTFLELCKILQQYFTIFADNWFLPSNENSKTNFQLVFGNGLEHRFSLEESVNQTNPFLNLHISNQLRYSREGVYINYVDMNDGSGSGFLDYLQTYGAPDPQNVDIILLASRQRQLAQAILDLLNSNGLGIQPILGALPGADADVKTAIFDFIIVTAVVAAVEPQMESSGSQVKNANRLFDQWISRNQVNLNNNFPATAGRTPGPDDYMLFLLSQFLDGEISDCFSLRDVFWGSGSNQGKYWPTNQLTDQKVTTILNRYIVGVPDIALSKIFTLYEQPIVPMPQSDANLQHLSNLNYDAMTTTKIRSAFEADVQAMQNVFSSAIGNTICSLSDLNKGSCVPSDLQPQMDSDSFRVSGNSAEFDVYDPSDPSVKVHVNVPLNKMTSADLAGELQKAQTDKVKELGPVATDLKKACSSLQTYQEFLGSLQDFERGDTIRGIWTLSQATKSTLDLMGSQNSAVSKALKAAFTSALNDIEVDYDQSSFSKVLPISEIKGIAGDIKTFYESITPFLDFVSDIRDIGDDISALRDANTTVEKVEDSIDIGIDVSILALDVAKSVCPEFAPEIEVAELVLGLIKEDLGYFVSDIAYELDQAKGKGAGAEIAAVLEGFGEAVLDILTGGFLSGLRNLNERVDQTNTILAKFDNLDSYFNAPNQDCNGKNLSIDFTAGAMSAYGGDLFFTMYDDNTYTVDIGNVPVHGGQGRLIQRYNLCPNLQSVIMGMGESARAVYTTVEAKIFWCIPVKRASVIDHLENDASTNFGSYIGNSGNNTFVAVQNIAPNSALHRLRDNPDPDIHSYQYMISGGGGNDSFFLGPQKVDVTGGEGNDYYYIATTGGECNIYNFATDGLPDMLYLNTSFSSVECYKGGDHLVIQYDGTHSVRILDWFVHTQQDQHRHLVLFAWDEVPINGGTMWVQLGIFDDGFNGNDYVAHCAAISINRALYRTGGNQNINVSQPPWTSVTSIVGGPFNDTITGNDLDDYIDGGTGQDILTGGKGADTYNMQNDEGCDYIDNFDSDQTLDTIILNASFTKIRAIPVKNSNNLQVFDQKTCVIIYNWYLGSDYQHVQFKTSDFVVFTVQGGIHNTSMVPYALDYSTDPAAIIVDLTSADYLKHVTTVKDSPFDDNIKGNLLSNTITCHGADVIFGDAGSETYVLTQSCANAQINNYDKANTTDVVLLLANFSDIYLDSQDALGLEIRNMSNGGLIVTFTNWFAGPSNQHAVLATTDGLQCSLPGTISELIDWAKKPVAYEISLSAVNCSELEVPLLTYDLSTYPYQNVSRFVAQSGFCSYHILGNSLGNYIDPGTGDPFGYQFLQGGPGSDTYVIGHLYGHFNQIDNFALDGKTDILQFGVMLKYIAVYIIGDLHVVLTSTSGNDTVAVQLNNYLRNTSYQHLLVQTADGATLQITPDYPYVKTLILDYGESPFSQIIHLSGNVNYTSVKVVYGSNTKPNTIFANDVTQRIVCGDQNDIVVGGMSNEQIEGLDGDDRIFGNGGLDTIYGGSGADNISGGAGDDVIYGGSGPDNIDGGDGSDAVFFAGNANTTEGVFVSLLQGSGSGADADGDKYVNVEIVHGSEFDDYIEGDDNDNTLNGYGGWDVLVPFNGADMLYGGAGNDTYNMTGASGWKSITNFATDEATDILLLNLTDAVFCQYKVDQDLYVHVGSVASNNLSAYLTNPPHVINLVIWRFFNSSTCQHLHVANLDGALSNIVLGVAHDLDTNTWLAQFQSNDGLQLLSATNESLTVLLSNSMQTIPRSDYRVDLTYACDGSALFVLTDVMQVGLTLTVSSLNSGVMCTLSLVLIRCNQIIAKGSSHHFRTLPNPPANIATPHVSSVSLTGSWQCADDLNCPLYNFQCFATTGNSAYNSESAITEENSTSCFIPHLRYSTTYNITVDAVAGGITSVQSAALPASTPAICIGFVVPQHTEITDERIAGPKSFATLVCDYGYYLAASQYPDGRNPITTWVGYPEVECDTLSPCTDATCTYKALCLPVPCSTAMFGPNHLDIISTPQPSYGYGDQLTTMCADGWAIGGQLGATLDIHCTCVGSCLPTGIWDVLPICVPVHNCTRPGVPDGSVTAPFNLRGDIPHGDSLQYACNPGYQLSGPTSATCNNGTLIPPQVPTCLVQYCEPCLRIPTNGKSAVSGTTIDCPDDPGNGFEATLGTTITYQCNTGYWMQGPSQQTCVLNGNSLEWSQYPQQVTCNPYPCTNADPCNAGFDCHDTGETTYTCVCNPPAPDFCCRDGPPSDPDFICDPDYPNCCPDDIHGPGCCQANYPVCCNNGFCCPSGTRCSGSICSSGDDLDGNLNLPPVPQMRIMKRRSYANSTYYFA